MTEKIPMHYIGVRDGKKNNGKRRQKQSKASLFSYTQYTKQNLKKLAQMGAEKSVTDLFVTEKEKCTNKGMDMQYVADSLKHSTTYHYQTLYQI